MKRIALILAFSLLAAVAVAAQDKPKADAPKTDAAKPDAKAAALPSADEILEKYIKAMGGKEAIEKTTSRAAKGSFEIEAMNLIGTFESYQKAPDKIANLFTIPGVGGGAQVFDGAKGWDSNPMTGLRELGGEELATLKREADFYQPLNFKKHFPKVEVKSKETVGKSETYLLIATPAEGGPEKLYFDIASGLLVRQDSERETAQGKMAIEEYFDDYKDVGGVKVPHTMKQVSAMFAMTLKFTEVKNNVPIEDTKFAKPAN
ncbi:MAG: hypothetical protein ACREAB_03260 [Blastocatellia bacterium]